MEQIVGILRSLGINQTLFIQIPIFLTILLFLWLFVFKPYFQAYLSRQGQTTGNQDEADALIARTRELERTYQDKARDLSQDIRSVFDREKIEAQQEHERILLASKDAAKVFLDNAKSKIQEEYNRSREELLKESPEIGRAITAQLLSRNN